jgi:hypothetical protein
MVERRRSWPTPQVSEFEAVVAGVFVGVAAEAEFERGVVGVAAGQEFGGVAVFGGDRFVVGQMCSGAVECGVAVGGGGAEFLCPGQVVGQGVDQTVCRGAGYGGGGASPACRWCDPRD